MSVQITLNLTPNTPPSSGWIIKYRAIGTSGDYITVPGSPFMYSPAVFNLPDGTWDGIVIPDCGDGRYTASPHKWSMDIPDCPEEECCPQITLSVSDITETSAQINYIIPAGITVTDVLYKTSAANAWTVRPGTYTGTGNFTLTGLYENTQYLVKFLSDCPTGNEIETTNFTTTTETPSCKPVIIDGFVEYWYSNISRTFTMDIDEGGTSNTATGYDVYYAEVDGSIDDNSDCAAKPIGDFTLLFSVTGRSMYPGVQTTNLLVHYAGIDWKINQGYCFRIVTHCPGDDPDFVDNKYIKTSIPCIGIENIIFQNATSTTIPVTFDNSEWDTGYQVEWRVYGSGASWSSSGTITNTWTGSVVPITYTATGLTSDTVYEFRFTQYCVGGDTYVVPSTFNKNTTA